MSKSRSRTIEGTLVAARDISRVFQRHGQTRCALQNVSFDVVKGQTLAVVGESGAGKSTLARIIAGLDRPTSGSVLVQGRSHVLHRGQVSPVQMVFQDPKDALNPFLSVGRSVAEPLRAVSRRERLARVAELFQHVGIDPARMKNRPSAFSGGQLQRIVIARALAASPKVLVCDEPTSALDVSVQAQIINLLLQLQAELNFGCVLVTHDLSVVRVLADDVIVLRNGSLVERASANDFFDRPRHAYSAQLLSAVTRLSLLKDSDDANSRLSH